jgi:hypothetical protein
MNAGDCSCQLARSGGILDATRECVFGAKGRSMEGKMRKRILAGSAAVLLVAALTAGPAAAQTTATCTLGVTAFIGYGVNSKAGAPYSATAKETFEQRLADGNFIHGVTTSRYARDAAGRTRSEMAQGCERGEDGQLQPRLSVNVFDPTARTTMFWQVDSFSPKVVRVSHQEAIVRKQLTAEERAERLKQAKLMEARQPRQDMHTERLGSRSINGILAEGTRTTRTIPTGEEGNDLPLVIVNETWNSRELGIMVMAINEDPRRGKTTFELEDISLGEPDAALFAPPAGYKVEDVHRMGQDLGQAP